MNRVNPELRSSFNGHHISATFELRGGGVEAAARRVERSESLDGDEYSSILIEVMADFWVWMDVEKYGQKYVEKSQVSPRRLLASREAEQQARRSVPRTNPLRRRH